MEAQAAEAQQAAQQLRGELAKAQAAAEDAARKAEEYRLQLAASALATQRVKEKEASLDQQQARAGAGGPGRETEQQPTCVLVSLLSLCSLYLSSSRLASLCGLPPACGELPPPSFSVLSRHLGGPLSCPHRR